MKVTIKSLNVSREYGRKNEPYRWADKLYIWTSGESILENLANRRSRPHTYYKKEVLPLVMAEVERKYPEFFKEVKGAKWGWRQSCGCSMCPCSPGFVADSSHSLTISAEILFEE